MTSSQTQTITTASPNDEGIRCPNCEYNLTGLAGEVCPECGLGFNRKQLLHDLANRYAPIPIWSRRKEIGTLWALLKTAIVIWARPITFAKRFPNNADPREALLFARWCMGVSLALVSVPFAFAVANGSDILGFLLTVFCTVVGINVCELTMAASVFAIGPADDNSTTLDEFSDSLAIVRMTRAYLIISSIFLGIFWVRQTGTGPTSQLERFIEQGVFLILGYWWVSMTCIAVAYRKSAVNLILSVIMMPICVAIGFVAGGVAGAIIAAIVAVFR